MNWITKAYNAHGGDKMRTTPADVMLLLLRLYKLDELTQTMWLRADVNGDRSVNVQDVQYLLELLVK